jgi:FlaA1/EpsC-like NDP-sugar epimerase
LKTIILGKRSYLSNKLKLKIPSSTVYNVNEFKAFYLKNNTKFNLIINIFYPSSKLSNVNNYQNFFELSIKNLSLILDKINHKHINKIIYTSSSSIYGSINEHRYANDANNRQLYSSTKLLNEIALNNYCQKKNIQLIVSRLFNMYGPNENFSIIHKLVQNIKDKKKIIINNNGESVRDFIHVDDVCEIYLKLLNTKQSNIYDIGSGYGTKIKDILNILRISKNKIIFKKKKINEVNNSIANISKISEVIKKKTFIKIEDFLKKEVKNKLKRKTLNKIDNEHPNTINNHLNGSIIYGCGFAGKKLAKKLIGLNKNNVSYFVDDNPDLIGKKYLEKKIISNHELSIISKKKIISNIIIAIPSLTHDKLISLYTRLFKLTLNISALPNKKNLLKKNKVIIDDLKNLDLGDIIKRKIFDIKKNSIKNFKNQSIIVTGGAGSIGSEISQQILRSKPKKLLIIDNSEYSLFKIKQKLGLRNNIQYILLDINYQNQIAKVIKDNKIKYIFHAAAYKHVNFLEENLISAVRNNILSTISLLESIKNTDINLTIISTDKAVEPKNVLGMTKRASEIIALSMSKEKYFKNSKISIVRFGNVFGSAGSAIEIFKDQIKRNLPITLTDIKMKRFFMSIREACNLVLQASQLKYSSSIFILRMGESIKIIDIINKMFNLMKSKNQKLKIKIIGKFKSEKLNEKLSNKKLQNTSINEINITNDKEINLKKVQNFLNNLDFFLQKLDEKNITNLLKKFTH